MNSEFITIDTVKEIAELKNRIKQAINKLYECGEVLDPLFQRDMLDILRGEKNE